MKEGTVTNVKRKRVQGGGSSYRRATRTEALIKCMHVCISASYVVQSTFSATGELLVAESKCFQPIAPVFV